MNMSKKKHRKNTDNVIKNEKIRHTNIKDNIQSNLPLKNANYTEQKSLSNSNKANTQQYSTEIFKSQLENMYTNAGKKYDIDLRNKEMWIEKPKFETYIPRESLGIVDEIISFPRKNFKNIFGNMFSKDLSRKEKALRILKPYIMSSPHISKVILENAGQVV